MKPFRRIEAISVPLMRINVDTDCIIPSREMKRVSKVGLADGLFAGWRYKAASGREPNPDFILNDEVYKDAKILLSGVNFGCGSSREHAVWALVEYGFKAIIAPSFGGIFYNNSIRNGLLPIILNEADISHIAVWVMKNPRNNRLAIDLVTQTVKGADQIIYDFDILEQDKEMLIEGFDMIDMTLRLEDDISGFEKKYHQAQPWAKLI